MFEFNFSIQALLSYWNTCFCSFYSSFIRYCPYFLLFSYLFPLLGFLCFSLNITRDPNRVFENISKMAALVTRKRWLLFPNSWRSSLLLLKKKKPHNNAGQRSQILKEVSQKLKRCWLWNFPHQFNQCQIEIVESLLLSELFSQAS